MGRHANAARTRDTVPRSTSARSHFPFPPTRTAPLGVLAFCLGVAVVHAADPTRRIDIAPDPDPQAFRPRVESFLAQGDTLEALELLQDRSPAGDDDWADSLLDLLVLPGPASAPSRSKWRTSWISRIDGGTIGSHGAARLWTTSAQTDNILGFEAWGANQTLRTGLRLHGLTSRYLDVAGLEPHVSWSLRRGSLDLGVRGWALWTNELGNDLGIDLQERTRWRPDWWAGPHASLSARGEQRADLGVGTDRAWGDWSLSGTVRAGWVRMVRPGRDTSRILDVDSIRFDGSYLDWTTRAGDTIIPTSDKISKDGRPVERIDPNRLTAIAQVLALWGRTPFLSVGPGLDAEFRSTTTSDRWLTDLRREWPSGTSFLMRTGDPSRVFAVHDNRPTAAEPWHRSFFQTLLLTPTLNGSWRSRSRTWNCDGMVGWNLAFASAAGHPLAEDREGLEARLASEYRW